MSSRFIQIIAFCFAFSIPSQEVLSQQKNEISPSTRSVLGPEVEPGWFLELPLGESRSALLKDGAQSILLKRIDWRTAGDAEDFRSLKGLFENLAAWQIDRIPVCFLGIDAQFALSDQKARSLKSEIAEIAAEWNAVPGVPDFDFGDLENPNVCSGNEYAVAVQIDERPSGSMVGRSARPYAKLGIPTMHLQLSRLVSGGNEMKRHVVLHEFGHALGLLHEIRHADGNCWEKFKKPELYAYYAKELGISDQEQVRTQLRRYDRVTFGGLLTITSIDQLSVMMYSFPPRVYEQASPPCWSSLNSVISDGDVLTLQKAYGNSGTGLMRLASLTSDLAEPHRRVVDAYVTLQTAPPLIQDELILVLAAEPDGASSKQLADAVFKAAHSPRIQSILSDGPG
ncbi:hypothetical protein [uncultured Erythrobacter sp.]|uniref:hypothetical protein n=1 Tax=uncultured Erythrobacter sp. TaxID=263913 RepID=UPI00262CA379|nr:hypothetical protein [uncultured Erythrobacter sp.]